MKSQGMAIAEWLTRLVAAFTLVLLVSAGASPLIGATAETDQERSDTFWDPFVRKGHYAQQYESIEEITDAVHLVVRGQLTEIRLGSFRYFERRLGENSGDPNEDPLIPILIGVVRVDEVLKGTPMMRTPGFIEVSLDSPWKGWEQDLRPLIPKETDVFFLMNDAQQRAEMGFPEDDPKTSPFLYWRPNGDQAVLRLVDGKVVVIEPIIGRYPSELNGLPSEALLSAVDAASVSE